MKPHRHAEVIKAFVDGKECEFLIPYADKWEKINFLSDFENRETVRVKPQPIVREDYLIIWDNQEWTVYPCKQTDLPRNCLMQLKLIYIDCILESSEVIK